MSRSKRVVYNTMTAALNMVVMQVVSLVVSVKVLEVYGADFHGLNSILSNVMIWVLLFEGGLTTTATVALYKPYVRGENDRFNKIISASRIQFEKIGILIFIIGALVALIYPCVLKTDIPYWDICLMFLIMSFSTSFGVYFTRKYAVMYSVTQNEYVQQLISILISICGSTIIYIIAISGAHYLWIRTVYMLTAIFTGIVIAIVIHRKYKFLHFRENPDFDAIKGTKHVVTQKLTAVVRTSAPSLFISVFDTTVAASIYAVNMYGYNFVRTIMNNVLNSTQSGIGQVVAEKNIDDVYAVYRSFEFVMITIVIWLMSAAMAVMIPFIGIYTHNVEGVNYINYFLWIILPINYAIQVFHLPSGVMINMNAKFKEDRNFQIISMIVMLIGMCIAGYLWGLNGIVLGATIGSLFLAIQEIHYTRTHLLHRNYKDFFRPLLIDISIMILVVYLEVNIIPQRLSIPMFFVAGVVVLIINGLFLLLINMLFERERMVGLYERFSRLIKKKA